MNALDPDPDVVVDVGPPASSPVPPLSEPPCLINFPVEDQLREFIASHSHCDWAHEQQVAPLCRAAIRYLQLGYLVPIPTDLLTPGGTLPPSNEVYELVRKVAVFTTYDSVQLLVAPRPSRVQLRPRPLDIMHAYLMTITPAYIFHLNAPLGHQRLSH